MCPMYKCLGTEQLLTVIADQSLVTDLLNSKSSLKKHENK